MIRQIICQLEFASTNSSDTVKNWMNTFLIYTKYLDTFTHPYNFDPLKPHFYKVKLGFTRVYIIFLISAQKHRLWVLIRTALVRQF